MYIYIHTKNNIWYIVHIHRHPQEKLRALQRLQRLEQRFTGPGVTEAEARNALRLFERELSKATQRRWGVDIDSIHYKHL